MRSIVGKSIATNNPTTRIPSSAGSAIGLALLFWSSISCSSVRSSWQLDAEATKELEGFATVYTNLDTDLVTVHQFEHSDFSSAREFNLLYENRIDRWCQIWNLERHKEGPYGWAMRRVDGQLNIVLLISSERPRFISGTMTSEIDSLKKLESLIEVIATEMDFELDGSSANRQRPSHATGRIPVTSSLSLSLPPGWYEQSEFYAAIHVPNRDLTVKRTDGGPTFRIIVESKEEFASRVQSARVDQPWTQSTRVGVKVQLGSNDLAVRAAAMEMDNRVVVVLPAHTHEFAMGDLEELLTHWDRAKVAATMGFL
jgi:hypothetical protein